MNKLFLTILFSIGCSLVFCTVAAPVEDLVRFPSGSAAWRIDFIPESGSASPEVGTPLSIVRVEVAQDGRMSRHLVHFSNKKERVMWSLSGLPQVLTEDPNGTVFFSGEFPPFSPPCFSWIRKEFLQGDGPVRYRDRMCFHYKGEIKIVEPGDKVESTIVQQAWIDSQSLFPVALDMGNRLGVFTFGLPLSPEILNMPQKFRIPLENKRRTMGLP